MYLIAQLPPAPPAAAPPAPPRPRSFDLPGPETVVFDI
jgi:hypothetical protein